MTRQYSIKDLEKLSGIKAHTIRIWEKRYDLLTPERSDTNIRYYVDKDLKRILDVSILQQKGLKISRISKLSDADMKQELESFYQQNTAVEALYEAHIVQFIKATVDLDEGAFAHHFSNIVLKFGLEQSFRRIIFPFLVRVGMLWTMNDIHPGHEHFVTNLIKQKLFSAIDGVAIPRQPSELYILYLIESEMHELSLLFTAYLLKSKGKEVIYLGQSTPFESLKAVVKSRKPSHLLTIFTTRRSSRELQAHLKKLTEIITDETVYISADPKISGKLQLTGNMQVIRNLDMFGTE